MLFSVGATFALELLALCAGALLILVCHRDNFDRNAFCKFVGYFTVILSFLAILGTVVSCFIFWMNGGVPTTLPKTHVPTHQQDLENKGLEQQYKNTSEPLSK